MATCLAPPGRGGVESRAALRAEPAAALLSPATHHPGLGWAGQRQNAVVLGNLHAPVPSVPGLGVCDGERKVNNPFSPFFWY